MDVDWELQDRLDREELERRQVAQEELAANEADNYARTHATIDPIEPIAEPVVEAPRSSRRSSPPVTPSTEE